VFNEDDLREYMVTAVKVSNDAAVLLDRFLDLAIEVDVDAVCDGEGDRFIKRFGLRVGDDVIAAVDVPPPDEANQEQTYSVHFVRFDITDGQRESLANLAVPASLSVKHPKFQATLPLPAQLRAQLVVDLAESP